MRPCCCKAKQRPNIFTFLIIFEDECQARFAPIHTRHTRSYRNLLPAGLERKIPHNPQIERLVEVRQQSRIADVEAVTSLAAVSRMEGHGKA